MGNEPVRVILVDDHNIVRRGLAALLQVEGNYTIVAEAENGEEAIRCADEVAADVMILDLSMPRLNGLEATRRLKKRHPQLKLLLLSMYDDEEFVIQSLQAGASGYILKHSMEDELFLALQAVLLDQQFISSSIRLPTADHLGVMLITAVADKLTSREREVLQLIAEGHTTAELAALMSISPHTASRHRANLMQKLEAHTQAGLVRTAIEQGLVVLKKPPQ
ncbi:Two-component transcriptional response regulator, LuxR family [hydrothermal vent metagenome]|uniref:Two-component transcriptional response regulator, LuxR family n=1 Tax=hydrothermal vent metagenome TaxID=652676 RepID=A0A3B1B4D9_9ZZZZ